MARPTGGRGRGRQVEPPTVSSDELSAWFAGNIPDDWFTEAPTVIVDRDEILVTGTLPMPKVGKTTDDKTGEKADDEVGDDGTNNAVAAQARIAAFREDSRAQRMAIAERAQSSFLRTVSWAVECGDEKVAYKTASVPVMTRLGIHERAVLDTLIDAGVARSRSEALAWCVELVADNESEWIGSLRAAMESVTEVRKAGPASRS